MKLKVLAVDGYCKPVSGAEARLPDLKRLVNESSKVPVRRVTRFVQLALIGAGRCCRGIDVSPDTAVYVSSCRGDTEVTAGLLRDLIGRNEPPSPVTFVNSVSNAACFHVARALALHGRSNFVTNRYDPITAALKTAYVDIARGETRTALVGSVDACSTPLAEHRQRTQVAEGVVIGEGSHWLLVAGESDPRPALASISSIVNLSSWEKMREWLEAGHFDGNTVLAPGQHLSEAETSELCELTGITQLFLYRKTLPHYDSQTGAGIEAFIRHGEEARSMLHVNTDPSGRYSLLRVER